MAFKLAQTGLRSTSSKQLEASSAILGRLSCVQGLHTTVWSTKSSHMSGTMFNVTQATVTPKAHYKIILSSC